MDLRNCAAKCKNKKENGNCKISASDKLPVQCVGQWVEDKYFYLERYLDATWQARRKFSDKGNAVFIDLFSGSGKCFIREEKREIDSGGIKALKRDKAWFNEFFYLDIDKSNTEALKKRIDNQINCHIHCGNSNILVKSLAIELLKKPYRYHFAFVDPFGPDGLKFATITELAKLKRMDLIIHFPIGAIKRNLGKWTNKKGTILDEFLGTDKWREEIKNTPKGKVLKVLTDIFEKQLSSCGYPVFSSGLRSISIKNTNKVDLYTLFLLSKHPLAHKIWNSIIKTSPRGERDLL